MSCDAANSSFRYFIVCSKLELIFSFVACFVYCLLPLGFSFKILCICRWIKGYTVRCNIKESSKI